ncbi:hypothetical protein [Arthrobacter oryzae]|uniref:hypothetical protein n=1 Tax=Arthrobacter oryzae TaxID=409290 RepID=UPI002861EE81|nr:hypothetical protein [Arthrobacter oryzae]MDR6506370.1 hypothetical protein [Arthrobacter oryzae]
MTMVIQKSEETRTLTGFHGGLRRGTAAAALGAVLVLSAGVPASHAVSLVPAPDTTTDAEATTSAEVGVPLLDAVASVVLRPTPDPSDSPEPGKNKPTRPGYRTQPSPSPSPTTEPDWSSPSPTTPTSPSPSPSYGTVPPTGTPAPSPTGGAAAPSTGPTQTPGTPAPATGAAPADTPAAPSSGLPGTAAPAAPGTGVAAPGAAADAPAAGGASRLPAGSPATGPASAAPASAWNTTNFFGPANMATLTSAGVIPLSGPGYGVSSAPVMRSAVSVSPVGDVSPQVWWGAGLVAVACAAGVAFVRMRRI